MTTMTTDRIEKQVLLRTPRSRVWRALADSKEFGTWFKAAFTEPFRPGAKLKGRITQPGYENLGIDIAIEKMQPERLLSFRWHPHAIDPGMNYSMEPMTLVEITLEQGKDGTFLRVEESGFDSIPIARRSEALRGNAQGWADQMANIGEYLRKNP